MRRAYKLRAYPTCPQEGRAVRLLADHCDLYNAALPRAPRGLAHAATSASPTATQSAQLKEIRATDPNGQGRHSFTAQQQTLRRLNAAFAAYFRRVRSQGRGAEGRLPSFQALPAVRPGAVRRRGRRQVGTGRRRPVGTRSFQAVGRIKVRQHRPVVGSGEDPAAQAGGPPLVCHRRDRDRGRCRCRRRAGRSGSTWGWRGS